MTSVDKRYYFDANALRKFYRDEKGDLNIRRLVANSPHPILVSPLTRLEFISTLMRDVRSGYLKRRTINRIIERLIRDIRADAKVCPFALISIFEDLFPLAERILLEHGRFSISSNDSLHLAIVTKLQSTTPNIVIVTSDNSMQQVCGKINLVFYDPEDETC